MLSKSTEIGRISESVRFHYWARVAILTALGILVLCGAAIIGARYGVSR